MKYRNLKDNLMKRTILISLAMVIAVITFGQSIVTTDKQWNNRIHYYEYYVGTEHIKFTSDTIIDSLTYKKVERSLDEYEQNWETYGFIRENPDKKIFYKIEPGDVERMIYDLNVQVHDTIYASGLITWEDHRYMDSMQYFIRNFDSILIDQTWRKRINLTLWPDTIYMFEQWIDSIGSLGGMLHNRTMFMGCDYYFLLCFFEDGILKYQNPDYSLCHYWPVSVKEDKLEGVTINISPNPITGISFLEIKNIDNYRQVCMKIFNLFGIEVWSKNIEKYSTINKEEIPPGFYLYRISGNDKVIGSGKLIVQ